MFIPGFDSYTLYADKRTEEEKKQYSKDFLSEEELVAITDDDFRLIRNITAYMPENYEPGSWKININSAPYHVILALSEFMVPQTARAVIVERIKNGGYFANSGELSKVSQLSLPSRGNQTLLNEISQYIVFEGRVYKIIVDVSIGSKTARVMGLYDAKAKKLVSYLE
jgi:general secretion pathway protein K